MTYSTRQPSLAVLAAVSGLMLSGAVLAGGQSSADNEMQMMDANQDGKITSAEHAAGARKMFSMMDVNKDGKVTAEEMDAGQMKMKGNHGSGHEMTSEEKIKSVDANHDGILTAAEHEAASRDMFALMDSDQDGSLTAAEIKSGHEKMMVSKKPTDEKKY